MEHTPNTTGQKTLSFVLGQKLVQIMESYSIRQMLMFVSLSFLAGVLSAAFVNLEGTVTLLTSFLAWDGSAIPKIAAVFALVFRGRSIWRIFRTWLLRRRVADSIEGIPTVEILDHLFTQQSFKRGEVEAKFQIPRYRVTGLGNHLERVGVLVRGESNARVLNPEFSRQDVASILKDKRSAKELEPLFRKSPDGCFTSRPSAGEIEERVTSLLSAPGFTIRHLAS